MPDAAPDDDAPEPVPDEKVRQIDIVDAQVAGGPHADFPMLVSLDASWLRDTSNGGDVARADGFDIYFSSDVAGTQRLAHETEQYVAVAGTLIAWVRIPSLTGTTTLYLHYGADSITTSQENRAAVWSGFAGVFHFGGAGDSSGTCTLTATAVTAQASARFGGGAGFDGSDSVINAGSPDATDNLFVGGGTVEGWIHPTTYGEGGFGRVLDKGNVGGWTLLVDNTNVANGLAWVHGDTGGDGNGQWESQANVITLGAWQHVLVVYDKGSGANAPQFFVNGVALTSSVLNIASGTPLDDNAAEVHIGNHVQPTRTFEGVMDELRLSTLPRTAGWVTTQYRNQNAPSSFYTVSAPL